MAVGLGKLTKKGMSWGHYLGLFFVIALAAWAGITFLPSAWTKVKGWFTKSTTPTGS